jgi:pyruvate dehydrogenase E1 component alpha subunit
VAAAAKRARAGDGPSLIEARTYRHFGHSRADPATYRPEEEVKAWLERDPLDLARARLDELGVSKEQILAADERAESLVADAVAAAKAAPPADPAEALTDVWADGGAEWRT